MVPSDLLAAWGPFFTYLGAAAATLLGLLFVAVSLRLEIFQRKDTADVRTFAELTLIAFVAVLVSCGLCLMPHEGIRVLAVPHMIIGGIGLGTLALLRRRYQAMNALPQTQAAVGPAPWLGWLMGAVLGVAFVGLIGTSLLLLTRDFSVALYALAGLDGLLLLSGTVNAWVMLTNAGTSGAS